MTIEKLFPSGAWLVYAVIDGVYIHRRYFGYTKREALKQFTQDTGVERRR